ncbi:MAG TPA: FtsW/RodA/SpoVE family cell cycle protein [Ktedonobacterales bacterium]|jgi:cell division protein FtsW (lipid II flippase)|nr:FtsW/RodA/SpoVE family cell cycle protein [Ktedonobacterales bacterium]
MAAIQAAAAKSRSWGGSFTRHGYRWTELWLLLLPSAFMLLGLFELLVVGSNHPVTSRTLPPLDAFTPALGLIAALFAAHLLLVIVAPDADQTLLPIVGMLASVGVLMALRLGPDLGQDNLGIKQLVFVILGLGACVVTVWGTRNLGWISNFKYTWAFLGLALVAIALVRAHNFSTNAPSRDVLTIGPGLFAFQPSELLKICLVIFFAGYLSENREFLAGESPTVGGLRLPPLKHLAPLVIMLGLALLIFVGVRELGLAILIFGLFLSMLYVATNRPLYVVVSIVFFVVGAYLALHIFSYARTRFDLVNNAFEHPLDAGYQIIQGLIALAHGGIFGSGLGMGKPWIVPASNTDYIATSFGEEFGFAGILALIGLFMLLVYRGLHVALRARDSFNQLMAVGLTTVFALQTLVILAGNLKLLPLTGVPLPFVAYGGSSVIANFIIIGLLLRLSQRGT